MEKKVQLKPRLNRPTSSAKPYPVVPRAPRWTQQEYDAALDASRITNAVLTMRRVTYAMRTYLPTGAKNLTYNSAVDVPTGINSSRTFLRNKDWRLQVALGQNAVYPYSRTGGFVKPITYAGLDVGNSQSSDCRGTYLGSVLIDTSGDLILRDIALARFKNRLNSYIGQANLLAPLAESREIHGLVHSVSHATEDMLKAMLLIKRTRGKSALKYAAKVWLTFSFGVNPLLADIAKAATAIQDYKDRQDQSRRVHGSARKQWLSAASVSGYPISEGCSIAVRSVASHELSYRYVGGVKIKLETAASYSVADHLGLQVGDLPGTLWELTVYSWVVDYVATVGPWLDDMFYTLPGVMTYLSLSQRYKNETSHYPTIVDGGLHKWTGLSTPGTSAYYSFSRTKLTELPHRSLRWRSFDEVGSHLLAKLTNIASVLVGGVYSPRVSGSRGGKDFWRD